jgi:hypothetical protein
MDSNSNVYSTAADILGAMHATKEAIDKVVSSPGGVELSEWEARKLASLPRHERRKELAIMRKAARQRAKKARKANRK